MDEKVKFRFLIAMMSLGLQVTEFSVTELNEAERRQDGVINDIQRRVYKVCIESEKCLKNTNQPSS